MKPFPFLLNVYLNGFLFILFSGIQLWGSRYALSEAMKGSFTALYGLHTSRVVLLLHQVNTMVKEFSQQNSFCVTGLVQDFAQQVVVCAIHNHGRRKDEPVAAAGFGGSVRVCKSSTWPFKWGSAVF